MNPTTYCKYTTHADVGILKCHFDTANLFRKLNCKFILDIDDDDWLE